MKNIEKLSSELFNSVIKDKGIAFRGINIGDSIDKMIAIEGSSFSHGTGTLPNYKYFIELGEMEELILVYSYHEESKIIYNIEVTLKTYPKYYWEQSGNTDELELYQQTMNNELKTFVKHFTACQDLITSHFENQLGKPTLDLKHSVYKHPHQNFSKLTWLSEDMRLVAMSFMNDKNYPQGPIVMELVLMLTAT